MPNPWSNIEVELIVEDYFKMLIAELSGKHYSKAEHRRNILPLLNNRSEGSIEFKHQNISAVLINLGQPYIKGYLPRYNYQNILEDKVLDYLIKNINIEQQFSLFAKREVITSKKQFDFKNLIVDPPKTNIFKEPKNTYHKNPIKINYLEKEQKNTLLGQHGEELVIQFEKWESYNDRKGKIS
jgi:hypothetical protein